MNPDTDHPLPNDLGALILIGAILIALAVVLPITHSGALAIAGLALIHVALAAWTVRTLDRNHADTLDGRFNLPRTGPTYTHHPEDSPR
jgi:hypothetical protein